MTKVAFDFLFAINRPFQVHSPVHNEVNLFLNSLHTSAYLSDRTQFMSDQFMWLDMQVHGSKAQPSKGMDRSTTDPLLRRVQLVAYTPVRSVFSENELWSHLLGIGK